MGIASLALAMTVWKKIYRLLCQISTRPRAASAAPYPAHWICLIMKLDAGQAIMPVPWPIQSRPIASAIKPRIRSNVRMGFPPSVPVLTFVSYRGWFVYEFQNQRDTSQYWIPGGVWD